MREVGGTVSELVALPRGVATSVWMVVKGAKEWFSGAGLDDGSCDPTRLSRARVGTLTMPALPVDGTGKLLRNSESEDEDRRSRKFLSITLILEDEAYLAAVAREDELRLFI